MPTAAKVGIIGGGGGLLLLCVCSGLATLLLSKSRGPQITEDYFPHKPGTVALYHGSSVPLGGLGDYTSTWEFEGEGRITKTARSADGRLLDTTAYVRRVKNGFVQTGVAGSEVWKPVLKVGAQAGDGWEFKHRNGGVSRFTVKAFDTFTPPADGVSRPCVVVQQDYNNGGVKSYSEVTYAKGIGVVLDVYFSVKDGKRTRNLESKLECGGGGDLSAAERAFFK
jgi:hypothetical protein